MIDGGIRLSVAIQRQGEIVVHCGDIRIRAQRGLEVLYRKVELALVQVETGEIVVRDGIAGSADSTNSYSRVASFRRCAFAVWRVSSLASSDKAAARLLWPPPSSD